jgi:hypothetical protein
LKIYNIKRGWWSGSSGRAPASSHEALNSNASTNQKKKGKKKKKKKPHGCWNQGALLAA